MAKVHVNACIDNDVYEAARAADVNISQALENVLRARTGSAMEIARTLTETKGILADVKEKCQRLESIIEGEELRIVQKREEQFDAMPELQNLTAEQATDSNFLLELVGTLRAKYNDKTISFTTLNKYLMRKAMEMAQPKA